MASPRRRPKDPEGRMSLGEHFAEFRQRALKSALAVLIGAIAAGYFYDEIFAFLSAPFNDYADANPKSTISLNFGEATSALSNLLSMSIFVGVIGSSPIWLYQAWAFVMPGLTRKEKRVSLAFMGATVPLFLGGVWLGYTILPQSLALLYGLSPEGTSNIQQTSMYFSFVMRFIMVFGLGFLFPVFLVGLNLLGILSAQRMLRGWRVAVVGVVIFAAAATPTSDPFTMFVFAGPLIVLYFAACGVAWLLDRRRAKARPDWLDVADDQASVLED
jgi:sec-independent protein translocase protein TatC